MQRVVWDIMRPPTAVHQKRWYYFVAADIVLYSYITAVEQSLQVPPTCMSYPYFVKRFFQPYAPRSLIDLVLLYCTSILLLSLASSSLQPN
eukprot:6174769-Pleurochrysis_carterae.AAC.1